MKKLLFASLTLAALCCADGKVIYVSNSGNDRNPGSEKAPLKTIASAAKKALPGDLVKIAPGLYREQIKFTRSGKEVAPVTFAGTRGKN